MTETSVKDSITIQTAGEVDPALLKMLDRGIDDVMSGRTIPHKDAMKEIEKIRDQSKTKQFFDAVGKIDIDKAAVNELRASSVI